MSTIFISYRRAETTDVAGRISERFIQAFGANNVFKDVLSIAPGVAFRAYVEQVMARSSVAVIVIGPQWRAIADDAGRPRLDDPADLVRVEITTALRYRVPIVILFVNGATAQQLDHLPPDLLALRQAPAFFLRGDPQFQPDLTQAMTQIANLAGQRVRRQRQARIRRRAPWLAIISLVVVVACVVSCVAVVNIIGANTTNNLNIPETLGAPTDSRSVYGMAALPNGEAWAVGSIIAHRNNGQWQIFNAPENDTFQSVSFTSAAEGYAVGGNDTIIHYHDNRWYLEYEKNTSEDTLEGVVALPNGEAWAIGGTLDKNGTILHRVKGQWLSVTSPVSDDLGAISFTGPADGWIGTDNGRVLHYDGTQWRETAFKETGFVTSIAAVAPDDVWAVADQLYHFDGAGWTAVPSDQLVTAEAVAALPNGEAWAIGSGPIDVNSPVINDPASAQVFHEKNGAWTGVAHTSRNDLGDIVTAKIALASSTEGWIYTYNAIWHGQNNVWTKEPGVP